MITKEEWKERREKLRSLEGMDLLIFPGNLDSPVNCKDNNYPFTQDATFQYFFGMQQAGLIAVMDVKKKQDYIFGKDYTAADQIWMGEVRPLAEEAASYGCEFRDIQELPDFLEGRRLDYCPYYRAETLLQMGKILGMNPYEINRLASEALVDRIIELRNHKSEAEIEEIEKAVNITRQMHLRAMREVKAGMKEYEVQALVEEVAASYDCQLSFQTILTKHGEVLHNHRHDNVLEEGDMLLLDAGAKLPSGYCGDMTTSFPVSKKFSLPQRRIYNLVIAMFDKAATLCRPGITYKKVHLEVCKLMAEGLQDLGLLKGDVENLVAAGAHALFMPHGLGHMLGLDVHDMENLGEEKVGYSDFPKSNQFGLSSLRLGRELEEGFVYTIEPGIYFIPHLIREWKEKEMFLEYINYEALEKYLDFGGIRYEGDFLITKDGCRRLGKKMLKEANEVEIYMEEGEGYHFEESAHIGI